MFENTLQNDILKDNGQRTLRIFYQKEKRDFVPNETSNNNNMNKQIEVLIIIT